MIYLDYSATTPVLPEILNSFNKVCTEYIGNPNSMHSLGIKSKELLNSATKQIAQVLNIKTNEIIYTSGSTESNNIALIGTAFAKKKQGNHIIVSKLEHESIYGICKYLEENGFIIDYVNNTKDGIIDFDDLKSLVTKDTILVSICAANSELGMIITIKMLIKNTFFIFIT